MVKRNTEGLRPAVGRPPDTGRTSVLIDRARAGDGQAWRIIHRRFYGELRRVAALEAAPWLLQREELDDLAMRALEDVLKGLRRFEYRSHEEFIHWLRVVARSAVLSRAQYYACQKRPKRVRPLDVGTEEGAVPECTVAGGDHDPVEESIEHEDIERVMHEAECLAPKERRLIQLFLLHSGEIAAMARTLDVPASTVRMRWVRLRRKLLGRLRHP